MNFDRSWFPDFGRKTEPATTATLSLNLATRFQLRSSVKSSEILVSKFGFHFWFDCRNQRWVLTGASSRAAKLRNKRISKILRQIFCSKVRQLTIVDIKFNFFNIKQIIALISYFYGLIFIIKNLKIRNKFLLSTYVILRISIRYLRILLTNAQQWLSIQYC